MPDRDILLIDDDASMRRVMEFTLTQGGYNVYTTSDGEKGLELFRQHRPPVVVTDLKMGKVSGFDVLKAVQAETPETLVIVVTAYGSIENAVEAMKAGAYDYLTKPFGRDELKIVVDKASKFAGLQMENRQLKQQMATRGESGIVTASPQMQEVVEQVERLATSDVTALILGESGTGKELIAKALHRASNRADKPFVALNCAAIPKEMIESELFGHVKGAFTGAVRDREGRFMRADGGTLFLDEIGELPLEQQPKLLRALQEREFEPVGSSTVQSVDVRVVTATNRDLASEVENGRFREDLYYRLAVIPVRIPPLRERPEDIALLFQHFLSLFAPDREMAVNADALKILKDYSWPGNVRELENVAQRMAILCRSHEVGAEDLPAFVTGKDRSMSAQAGSKEMKEFCLCLPEDGYSLEALEQEAIRIAMQQSGGNKSKAASFLKIPRHVLVYRLEKYDL